LGKQKEEDVNEAEEEEILGEKTGVFQEGIESSLFARGILTADLLWETGQGKGDCGLDGGGNLRKVIRIDTSGRNSSQQRKPGLVGARTRAGQKWQLDHNPKRCY
jgi:hypothetical protein